MLGCLALLTILFSVGCAHQGASADDPDGLYAEAEEALKDERYLIAIEKFRDIKNRFPYSSRAIDAELRIADAYYDQESFLEAESAYEIFRELHPTHAKSDYVQFRIAMSYFGLIPANSARDLSAAFRAIDAFTTLQEKYPSSQYLPEAKERIQEARRRLAEHEHYVAEFYYRRRHYLSASYRYSALLQDYGRLGYDEEALYRLGECYFNTKMFDSAKNSLQRLLKEFPQSSYKSAAESILQNLSAKN